MQRSMQKRAFATALTADRNETEEEQNPIEGTQLGTMVTGVTATPAFRYV